MTGVFLSMFPTVLKNLSAYLKIIMAKKALHEFFKSKLSTTNITSLEFSHNQRDIFLTKINNVDVKIDLNDRLVTSTVTTRSHLISSNRRLDSSYVDSLLIEANIKNTDLDFLSPQNLQHILFLKYIPQSKLTITKDEIFFNFTLVDALRQEISLAKFYAITMCILSLTLWLGV